MDYKKILVIHPTYDPLSSLNSALDFARSFDAQIDVLVLNSSDYPTIAIAHSRGSDWSEQYSDLLLETDAREKEVTACLAEANIRFSVTAECAPLGMIDNIVAKAALCTDIVVFTNSQSSFVSGIVGQALEGALLDSGKPVLALTGSLQPSLMSADKVVIAWDEVPQAAKAVQFGLPILQAAKDVELLVIKESSTEPDSTKATDGITEWLKCHDIDSSVTVVARNGQFVSHALANHFQKHFCDLLIMGAYGHTRFTEKLFAGATHIALTDMQVPLLLAH